MATKMEDTLATSSTRGSGVYGDDTASVDGDKASKPPVHEAKETILRLSIKSFGFGRQRSYSKEEVLIVRLDQRKVALRLPFPLGKNRNHWLLIDLDRVVLVPCTYIKFSDFQCMLQEQEGLEPYQFQFETVQDLFKFQEVFTGFSVLLHISDVAVFLQPKGRESPAEFFSDIQLWTKVPNRSESLIHTHDGLRTPSQLLETGAKAESLARGKIVTQPRTMIPSDISLRSINSSVMKRHASSLLVFPGQDITDSSTHTPFVRVPIDERISIAKRGEPLDVTLVVGGGKTSRHQNPSLSDTFANRSSATASGAAGLITLGLTATEYGQASRLSEIDNSDSPELDWVKLEFAKTEGREAFVAALNALIDPHQFLYEAETHDSNRKPFGERGSLTRKSKSAVFDADDVIPPAEQTSANPESTPLHKAKAGQVNSSAPLSQPRRDLAGDSTNHPEGRADVIPLVAGSLDSKFGSRRGLAGNSAIHPDGRAGSIPSIAGPLNSKFRTRRGLAGNSTTHPDGSAGIDPQRSTNSSITSNGVGKMRSGRHRSWSDILREIMMKKPPRSETSAKQKQWRRRICRKIVIFMLWKWEQNDGVPKELWSSPASFEFISGLETSRFDKIKCLFETYSGREWDWWPFDPPAKPLESGKVRIRWQCTCGDQRWTDASRYLSRKCQALVNENTTAGHERDNATSQSAGSAASHSHPGSVVPGSFPSDTSQPTGVTSNIRSTTQASHIQDINKASQSNDLYVLLCIYQGSQILHSQILASKCQNDEAFFENLRQEYRRLRGFLRFWCSPLQFSHCDFVKFTRFYVNELAKVGHSLPIDLVYQYNPRPPGPHEDPPISPHEFRRRFYTHFANPCSRDEALERIPKRQKRFQINLHVDGREDMWGLHVELRPCFLVVLMWQIAITAGGWAFMAWWLSRHQGDLQNAAVPVTLIVMAVMALWAPISKGMTEAL